MQRRLVERVERYANAEPLELWIIFDRRTSGHTEHENVTSSDSRISVFYAPSADDWIVTQVEDLAGQQAITVVTADRLLRERVRRVGGALCSPMQFLVACKSLVAAQ